MGANTNSTFFLLNDCNVKACGRKKSLFSGNLD